MYMQLCVAHITINKCIHQYMYNMQKYNMQKYYVSYII